MADKVNFDHELPLKLFEEKTTNPLSQSFFFFFYP